MTLAFNEVLGVVEEQTGDLQSMRTTVKWDMLWGSTLGRFQDGLVGGFQRQ